MTTNAPHEEGICCEVIPIRKERVGTNEHLLVSSGKKPKLFGASPWFPKVSQGFPGFPREEGDSSFNIKRLAISNAEHSVQEGLQLLENIENIQAL